MSTPRPNYGITRIDQPDKKNHGFYVRITHKGKSHQKYFPDKASGGKTKALAAAKAYRDQILAKMPKYKQEAASRKKRRIKKSGITVLTNSKAAGWEEGDNGAVVTVETPKGEQQLECDKILVTVGRRPNSEFVSNLGLEMERGHIVVDKQLKTNIDEKEVNLLGSGGEFSLGTLSL